MTRVDNRADQQVDGDLLRAIAAGDEHAMESFYRLYETRVFRFIQSKISDSFAAADVLNEVMLAVWRSASSYDGRGKVSTWVFGIAYRKSMDHFRKHRKEDLVDELPETPDESDSPLDLAMAKSARKQIDICLDKLSAAHRAVIELAFFEELPYQEIAQAVDCPEGTVKTRVYHAKQLLKECLRKLLGNVPCPSL